MSTFDLLVDLELDRQHKPRRLQHAYMTCETNEDGEPHDVWVGRMRIVRSRKRMRKLKRRGVPLLHLGVGNGTLEQQPVGPGIYGPGTRSKFGPWAWFETEEGYGERKFARFLLRYGLDRRRAIVTGFTTAILPPEWTEQQRHEFIALTKPKLFLRE